MRYTIIIILCVLERAQVYSNPLYLTVVVASKQGGLINLEAKYIKGIFSAWIQTTNIPFLFFSHTCHISLFFC